MNRVRLYKWLVSRKPRALGCGCTSVLIFVLAIVATVALLKCDLPSGQQEQAPRGDVEADAAPKLLLSRLWFDKLPEKPRDEVDLWIFLAGGIGLHERGSYYRYSLDVFEFERQGSTLDATFLQDKKRWKTSFKVDTCQGHEPFNLCLSFTDPSGNKRELYGFQYDDEMERAAPGSSAILAAARARAGAR